MAGQITDQQVGLECFNGFAPRKGPRFMPLSFDFTSQASYTIDCAISQETDRIEWAQGIFVDNASNANALTITWGVSNQRIIVPAGWQGYVPVLVPNPPRLKIDTTIAAVTVNVYLLTFPVPLYLWPSNGNTVTISGTVVARDAGSVGTDFSATPASALANLLTTVAVNANRNEVYVQNQSANQIQVALDDGVGGTVTYILLEGGGANTQGADFRSTTFKGRLRVYGGSALQQVGVREF